MSFTSQDLHCAPMCTSDRLAIHAGCRTQKEMLSRSRTSLDDITETCPVCGKRAFLDVYTSRRADGVYEVTQYRCELAITCKPPKYGKLKTREGAHPIYLTERKLEDTPMPPLPLKERDEIKALRNRASLTNAQMAEKLKLKPSRMSVILAGDKVSDACRDQILQGCAALEKEIAAAPPAPAAEPTKPEGVEGPRVLETTQAEAVESLAKVGPEPVVRLGPVDVGMQLLRELAPEKRADFVQLLMDGCQLLAQEEAFRQAQSRFLGRTA